MKIKMLLLTVFILTVGSIACAQAKTKENAQENSKTDTPEAVVKNLYEAHASDKSPFNQTKNRGLVDRYFTKDLADMIWKDAVDAKGEVGAIDFDPLYGSQEESVDLVIEKPREAGGPDNAFVKAVFKTLGKAGFTDYELAKESGKWKIVGIYYSNGEDLGSTLRYYQDEEFRKEFDGNQTFAGEYTIGTTKCIVSPTLNGLKYRVECEGEEGFKLYQVEGTETETAFIHTDERGQEKEKFVFKNGEPNGKFIDASGKETNVMRTKQ